MSDYVVYHNCEKMNDWLTDDSGESETGWQFSILTSKDTSKLEGHTVWLIKGTYEGNKKRKSYYLRSKFKVEDFDINPGDDNYAYSNEGEDYQEQICLNKHEPWFSAFRHRMANFSLGLQKLSDEDVRQLKSITGRRSAQKPLTGNDQPVATDEEFTGRDLVREAKARQDQQKFTESVKARYGNACLVCGINEPELLVAAHIVRWADDKRNRLNPANGLRLCANHDKAFEYGLFTVDKKKNICVSKQLSPDSVFGKQLWKLHGKPLRLQGAQEPDEQFLAKHRERFKRESSRSSRQDMQSNRT